MAVFDPVEERMCVRVVYDGAAGAGKSTNLRQIGNLFASQRTAEVISPSELRGRTLYFDWMRIAAGVVCGFPVICQLISVPGQVAFTERRRYLLSTADVIVYVCESTQAGADRARDAFHVIDEIRRAADIKPPVLIQANKQDRVGAFDGKRLAAAIRRPELAVVEAIATEGVGVVDTFVSAVRTVSRTLQTRMESNGLRVPVRRAQEMQQVLEQVARAPIDPYGAAELLLEEASAALLFDTGSATHALLPEERKVVSVAPSLASSDISSGISSSGSSSSFESTSTSTSTSTAPLPRGDVPTGFIWPAHTGRTTLAKLARGGALAQSVAVGTAGIERVIEDRVLSTSASARFAEADMARHALVRAARERTQLGSLLVNDTVLVVQPASDGASWLWTVTPVVEPIQAWLDGDPRRLEIFAAAVVQAVVVSTRHRIALAPTIGAFGVQHGNVRYKGALEAAAATNDSGAVLLQRVASELAALGHDLETFTLAIERELSRRLEPRELLTFAQSPVPEVAQGSEVARELLSQAMERLATGSTPEGAWALTTPSTHVAGPEAS
jgi:signal recognition particle receptor subunit beta